MRMACVSSPPTGDELKHWRAGGRCCTGVPAYRDLFPWHCIVGTCACRLSPCVGMRSFGWRDEDSEVLKNASASVK